jgi:hypothetical protein
VTGKVDYGDATARADELLPQIIAAQSVTPLIEGVAEHSKNTQND